MLLKHMVPISNIFCHLAGPQVYLVQTRSGIVRIISGHDAGPSALEQLELR